MTGVQELEEAVTRLSSPELAQFMAWLEKYRKTICFRETRLAQECAKLDPAEEQAWADWGWLKTSSEQCS